MTMAVMIQPDVLTAIGSHPRFRGRGLLGRILLALPQPKGVGNEFFDN